MHMQFFKRKQDQSGKKWGPITLECDDDNDDCACKVLLRFLTKHETSSDPDHCSEKSEVLARVLCPTAVWVIPDFLKE